MLIAGFMAPAAWLLSACGDSGGDLISTVALPSQQTAEFVGGAVDVPLATDTRMSATPELTPAQRDYLGALAAAGIQPANELRALGIGAYVCQARAAGQSEQAVWDSVAPMVRSDVVVPSASASRIPAAAVSPGTAPAAAQAAPATGTDSIVSNVISIATGRLC